MRALKNILAMWPRPFSAARISQADRQRALRSLIGTCPQCRQTLEAGGHSTWRLASTLIGKHETETASLVADLVKQQNWTGANTHHEWRSDSDLREYRILRCPTGDLTLLALVFAGGLWASDYLESYVSLDPVVSGGLNALIGGSWESL